MVPESHTKVNVNTYLKTLFEMSPETQQQARLGEKQASLTPLKRALPDEGVGVPIPAFSLGSADSGPPRATAHITASSASRTKGREGNSELSSWWRWKMWHWGPAVPCSWHLNPPLLWRFLADSPEPTTWDGNVYSFFPRDPASRPKALIDEVRTMSYWYLAWSWRILEFWGFWTRFLSQRTWSTVAPTGYWNSAGPSFSEQSDAS